MKKNEVTKELVNISIFISILISIFIFVISFVLGVAIETSKGGRDKGCEYRSIGSKINIGYILGCEISKNRF